MIVSFVSTWFERQIVIENVSRSFLTKAIHKICFFYFYWFYFIDVLKQFLHKDM